MPRSSSVVVQVGQQLGAGEIDEGDVAHEEDHQPRAPRRGARRSAVSWSRT